MIRIKKQFFKNFLEISNGIKISLSLALINHGRQKGITFIVVRHLYQSPLENLLSFGKKQKTSTSYSMIILSINSKTLIIINILQIALRFLSYWPFILCISNNTFCQATFMYCKQYAIYIEMILAWIILVIFLQKVIIFSGSLMCQSVIKSI